MTLGTVTKLVTSFGSQWGRVRPYDDKRELFFNPRSLVQPADFAAIREGQEVEFEEEADYVNGAHAINMRGHSNES